MNHVELNQSKTKGEATLLAAKQETFDPNGCLKSFIEFWDSAEVGEFGDCTYCESEQTMVYSLEIELENQVTLSCDELGDNVIYHESVISELTDIVTHLDEYVESAGKALAPIANISFGQFCACCLESTDVY